MSCKATIGESQAVAPGCSKNTAGLFARSSPVQRTNVSGQKVQAAAAGEPLLFGLPVAVLKNDTREHQRIEVLPLSRPNLTGRQ